MDWHGQPPFGYGSNRTEGSELNLRVRKADDFITFQIHKAIGNSSGMTYEE